jgi:hypothetical protein
MARRKKKTARETEDDLKMMFTIILDVRRQMASYQVEFDEKLAWAALCRWTWPGKRPSYRRAVMMLRSRFRGIADSPKLQHHFRQGIKSSKLRVDRDARDIRFRVLSDVFKGYMPPQRVTERLERMRAAQSRLTD